MNYSRWYKFFGLGLVILSAIVYYFHYQLFHDAHHIFIFLVGDIAFVPIEVLLVSMVIHHFLSNMEKRQKLEKLNMVIGTFFSEVGTNLLTLFSDHDPKLDNIRHDFMITDRWSDEEFANVSNKLQGYNYSIDLKDLDLDELRIFLNEKRGFLLRLLENPIMLEHETFTQLLRAVFHMTEEFDCRDDFGCLPDTDLEHLRGDIERSYGLLVNEWLAYMHHLKDNYPYLFSLAMRTNPFDRESSPIVK